MNTQFLPLPHAAGEALGGGVSGVADSSQFLTDWAETLMARANSGRVVASCWRSLAMVREVGKENAEPPRET